MCGWKAFGQIAARFIDTLVSHFQKQMMFVTISETVEPGWQMIRQQTGYELQKAIADCAAETKLFGYAVKTAFDVESQGDLVCAKSLKE
ncbi:hypothetical protein IL60_0201225 [Brucella inopinata BO1]|uniref:Uncharacterized protein n=1 Tax=Brucella suis TaxID=29461 RepID=A0AAU8QW41_BRUSS|nr:hypothetical protein IY71_07970 [Brucella suis]ALY32384.1 hypothetical protein AWH03_10075 [Brucella suis 019]AOG36670.1 hypothetical protein BFL29_15250 [Brucella canis]EEW89394.1 predicted protein [Brucella suis bv. 4 str. 40]KEY03229.1 hypothetical protein IL60_0201225 [Brucella inopinata BO1]